MDHEQSETLSRAELNQILQCQQRRIEKLSATLAGLETRVAKLEAELDQIHRIGQSVATAAKAQREKERTIRDALRHLDDVAYLAQSRLAQLIAGRNGQLPDGHTLQGLLARAIHKTKPAETSPQWTREHRRYEILHLTYLKKKHRTEIAETLAISERQYYRELKAAIQKVLDQVLSPPS